MTTCSYIIYIIILSSKTIRKNRYNVCMGTRAALWEKMETIDVSKLAKDWLTSHVTREEYNIILYYIIIMCIIMYTIGARRMCGVAPNTPFWLLNKRHMSDSFKKNKTRQIAFTSVCIICIDVYYKCTDISSDRVYKRFETQTEQPQPYKLDLCAYNITHARACARV